MDERARAGGITRLPRIESGDGSLQSVTSAGESPTASTGAAHRPMARGLQLLRDRLVDFTSFLEMVGELEAKHPAPAKRGRKPRTEAEHAKRFDELQPQQSDGSLVVHAQDVRITALYEALSRSHTKVLELLRSMDTDRSGAIDLDEFKVAVRNLGYADYSDADLAMIFGRS